MTMYKMFSNAALDKFREFAAIDAASRVRPQGAADVMPSRLSKRRQAHDAENEGDLPDKATIEAILNAASDGGDEDGAIALLLHSIWPGCAGRMAGDKPGESDDDVAQRAREEWRNRDGSGAEDDEDNEILTPAEQFRRAHSANDQPPPFKGMPKVGGGMVAQDSYFREFPDAARIGVSLYPVMLNGNGPTTMVPRSSLNKRDRIAFDAACNAACDGEGDYLRRFPDAAKIGILG
jgi:hypothetical protein